MTPPHTVDRLDDLPLLVGLMRQLRLDAILETHRGTHGNTRRQMDVGNGLAMLVRLVYLMAAGDHRKVVGAAWVEQHAAVRAAARGSR
jgi:hypothetical protein